MAWSLSGFEFRVRVAFGDGPRAASPTWTDVTDDVMAADGITMSRGRRDGYSRAGAGLADLRVRNWADGSKVAGRWTPGVAAGPWHPLRLRRPVNVGIKWAGVWYDLWTGHVTDYDPKFIGAAQAVCDLSCSDLLANIGQTKLPPLVLGEMLDDGPLVCYPLDDDEGSVTAGDRTGSASAPLLSVVQLGTGGSVDFGAGIAPGPDDATVAAFTRADATNGKYLAAATGLATPFASTLEAMVRPSTTAAQMTAAAGVYEAYSGRVTLGTSSAGKARATLVSPLEGISLTLTGTSTLSTTSTSHLALTQSLSGTTVTCTLYVNGTAEATGTYTRDLAFNLSDLRAGGTINGDLWDGQVSHVAAYDSALSSTRIAAHSSARTGFTGERTDQRFARLCRLAGLPTGLYSTGTGLSTMGAQGTDGKALPAALAEVEDAEAGVVAVDATGDLRLYVRGTRYNAPVALTLDARTEVKVDTGGFLVNDDGLLNDITVTRVGGATQRYVNATSVADYGTQNDSRELYLADDTQLAALGQYLVNQRATPTPKAPTLKVSLARLAAVAPTDVPALLTLDIGSRVQVTNLPAGAPASTVDLFVEGLDIDVQASDVVFTFNTSNVGSAGSVWQLDSATYSVLGSTTRLGF